VRTLLEAAKALAEAAQLLAQALAEQASPPPAEDAALLTVRQLGARLHRSPSTVRSWVEAGRFAGAVKVGRGWLVPASSVVAFLDEQRPETPLHDQPGRTIPPGPVRRPHPPRARDGDARVNLGAWREVRRP